MDKVDFKLLASQLMFSLSDEELVSISRDFEALEQQLALLEEIDTTDVSEMIYPFEQETDFLRDDVVSDVLSKDKLLANAHKVADSMVVVPKVVK